MGQGPSAAEREHARKASSTILREDSFRVEESENVSLTDSWSMHFDCTTQAPYSTAGKETKIPRTDLPRGSKENPLYELAQFLRNTGPLAPHRRPSKIENPSRAIAKRRKALQFLRLKQQNFCRGIGTEHEKYVPQMQVQVCMLTIKDHVQSFETRADCYKSKLYLNATNRKCHLLVWYPGPLLYFVHC
jgi:hypothetical protein